MRFWVTRKNLTGFPHSDAPGTKPVRFAVIIFFKSGEDRIVRYYDEEGYEKIHDEFPPEDMELAKEGKLADDVGPGMYRTKYKKEIEV